MGTVGLAIMAVCFGAGAATSLFARLSPRLVLTLGSLFVFGGAVAGCVAAVQVLLYPLAPPLTLALPALFPFARLSLRVDGLSAFFLLVVSIVAVSAALYGPSYLRAHAGQRAPGAALSGVHSLSLNVFVGSMAFVCCAGDALTFLLAWEGMTLASYMLVVSDPREPKHTDAGLLYMVMAHLGTALLLFVFIALTARAGSFEFGALRSAAHGLSPAARSTFFFLALTGLAAKAGVVPLHVWLPHAHPAAPSHVSALMSGVMLKVAIYGMLRFTFDLLAPGRGPLPVAWGWTVLGLGTSSALVGVLYALQQHDIKRLLAFHSVENVGIILMGMGLAMLVTGRSPATAPLATLALTAAILHTLNHATFKGLLFLGAGSVISRTHVRNMEELGGLARRMPWTASLFLLGAVAISALPPLNGFVSEWMTFQALIFGGVELGGAAGLCSVTAASMLALTGGLAAACFAKAFGVTFLGRPRSSHAESATEAPLPMLVAMALLAAACVALGVLPGFAMPLLERPAAELLGTAGPVHTITWRGPLVLSSGVVGAAPAVSVTVVAALFVALALMVAFLRFWPRSAGRRLEPTWTCGFTPTSRFDYTATSFAKPLLLIFAMLYRPRRNIERVFAGTPYVLKSLKYSGEMVDFAEVGIYRRIQRRITFTARAIRLRSTGRIHGYIGFVLATLMFVLLVFGRG